MDTWFIFPFSQQFVNAIGSIYLLNIQCRGFLKVCLDGLTLGQEGNHSFCQIYYVLPALRQERKSNNLPATYKDTFGYGIIEFSIMELVRVIESQKEIPKEHRIAAQITSHN